VRRRTFFSRSRLVIGTAFAVLVLIAVGLSVQRYRAPPAAPPEALAHIAEKNRDAAVTAAARQRAESAASTNQAEALAAAQSRGAAEADTAIAAFPNDDNRAGNAGRRD
jgi:hypothetical protein